jgi:hypothetical protein
MGGLHYVPNFGQSGILVAFGGDQVGIKQPGYDSFISFNTVQVYDTAGNKWYEQTVTGNIPENRKEFCTAGLASNNETYEIFMYAGWNGNLGEAAVPFDEAYVLTLPGFNWVKASYPALNPRHGLTCNSIGGGQILTIGGLNSSQNGPDDLYKDVFNTQDQFTQGLAVFDLNTLSWKDSFSASQTTYSPAPQIRSFYANKSVSILNTHGYNANFSQCSNTNFRYAWSQSCHEHPKLHHSLNRNIIITFFIVIRWKLV